MIGIILHFINFYPGLNINFYPGEIIIRLISYNVAMIMLHALHIATNKKPNGISPVGFLFVNVATIPTASKGI